MTSIRLCALGLALSGLSFHTDPVCGQDRLGLEVRPTVAVPGDLYMGTRYHTGYGVGLGVDYGISQRLAMYGGWDWYRFPAINGDADYTYASGPSAGLQVRAGVSGVLSAWLRGGGTYMHLHSTASDRNLGWETAGGIEFVLRRGLRLRPGVRYRTFTRTYTIINIPDASLNAATIGQRTTERHDFTSIELAVAFRR